MANKEPKLIRPSMWWFMKPKRWEVSDEFDHLTAILRQKVAFVHVTDKKIISWEDYLSIGHHQIVGRYPHQEHSMMERYGQLYVKDAIIYYYYLGCIWRITNGDIETDSPMKGMPITARASIIKSFEDAIERVKDSKDESDNPWRDVYVQQLQKLKEDDEDNLPTFETITFSLKTDPVLILEGRKVRWILRVLKWRNWFKLLTIKKKKNEKV